ncbi:MAG: hypothetical protein V1720_13725 [bacterium]
MNSYKNEWISFLNSHPEYFEEAIQLAVSDKQPYSWRSAFLLGSFIEENDKRIKKHIPSIMGCIQNKKDGHQRELLKILYKMEIKEKHEGQLFNICMNLWEQIDKDPSVRITALKFIIKIVKKYPELSEEIMVLTQDQYLETLSPGVKSSVNKIIQEVIRE